MQKYQKVTLLKLVISQLKNNFLGVCKSLKPSSGNSLGPGNLFKHCQEPPVLHNSNYQVGPLRGQFLISQLKINFLDCFKSLKSSPA